MTISSEARQLLEQERAEDSRGSSTDPRDLSSEEERDVQELRARDAEVRRHEQAHVAASGHLPTSGPSYTYEEGPDGRRYAVGGEVQISFGEGRNPEETLRNAEAARRAALAPAQPSAQDRRVAAKADALAAQARAEQQQERREGRDQGGIGPGGVSGDAAGTQGATESLGGADGVPPVAGLIDAVA